MTAKKVVLKALIAVMHVGMILGMILFVPAYLFIGLELPKWLFIPYGLGFLFVYGRYLSSIGPEWPSYLAETAYGE